MLKRALLILQKDVAIEMSQLRMLPTAAIMAILIILIFAVVMGQETNAAGAAAILAVSFVFCGIVASERSFDSETANGAIDALRITAGSDAIFWGKWLLTAGLLLLIEIWNCAVFCVIFNFEMYGYLAEMIVLLVLFNIAFASVGAVFSAMVAQCRQKGFILTILVLPILIGPVIATTMGLKMIFSGYGLSGISNWLKFMAGFDIIFTALAWMTFEKVIE